MQGTREKAHERGFIATTSRPTKLGAAIEKLYAPANIMSDTDGVAEFTKFELL